MESYQVKNTAHTQCYQRGESRSLRAMEVFVSPSSGCPRASLAPPQYKGRDSIMKWHLEACSKSTLLQKRSLKMYPCPLSPSVCLPVSLSFSSSWCVSLGGIKQINASGRTHVRGFQGRGASVSDNFSSRLYSFIDSEQLVHNWGNNSAHTAASVMMTISSSRIFTCTWRFHRISTFWREVSWQ